MKLEHNFTIPVPVDTVWRALLDPERVAPCFPGATVTSASGEEFAGTVKVRLGPISMEYKGEGRFTETDEAAHRTVIEASGTASGGQSAAATTVIATLIEDDGGTAVTVVTQLSITGKPAQFGRGLLEDVGGKIIGQFADCLATSLGSEQQPATPAPETPVEPAVSLAPAAPAAQPVTSAVTKAAPAPSAPVQPVSPVADEIDLLDAAGGAVAKRVVPVIGGLALLALIVRWFRRR